jgi:predicted nucleotide-binding protein (sugar kinase/HSP70/actin superfamily)
MIRAADDDLPDMISPTINIREGKIAFYKTISEIGAYFNKSASSSIRAYRKAFQQQKAEHLRLMKEKAGELLGQDQIKIGVIGHSYNINETYATMNIAARLRKMGALVQTSEELPVRIVEREARQLPKKLFWTYEKEVVGSALHWLKAGRVDGVIYVLAFACGPDSFIQTVLELEAKRLGKVPLISIIVDEHSGEAGLVTRLEAFVDMLVRKKRAS